MRRRLLPLAAGLAMALAGTAGAQSLSAGMSQNVAGLSQLPLDAAALPPASVSYTHLTLPTILRV